MSAFWKALGGVAVKFATYCLDHPDQVIAVATQIKTAKGAK